ncbi:hypothetical protein PA25_35690 [Pseudoalteromonas sp. A25]|uniref:4'-phosphopantetheinyl transferase family protein n=1 Tax=Pseudoalteromonas sp. A25 TaxID=116092 RepID=UPI00126104BF|nr:4'-phosphopantetheinyl transferase superfamily protein [Pseudoalteromonas sp. A25]BBN83584.1 hypothetical protein PA25_35690 [Pseudoalteromonas sp. A25]
MPLLTCYYPSTNSAVYIVHLDVLQRRLSVPSQRQYLLAQLSEDEHAQYMRKPYKRQALAWLGARLGAKWLLKNTLFSTLPSAKIQIQKTANGAPFCARSGRPLSISHSNTLAGAAISNHPVGLDLEFSERFSALPTPWISPQEKQAHPNLTISQLWCIKEALYKAAGFGPFTQFCRAIELEHTTHKQLTVRHTTSKKQPIQKTWRYNRWQLKQHDILFLEPYYE